LCRDDCGDEKCRLNHPRARGKGAEIIDPVDERMDVEEEEEESEEVEEESEEESEGEESGSDSGEEEYVGPVRF
jgi:hypothetical protein